MSKVKLEVTLEDAFIIGQLEGQKKIVKEIVEMFMDQDFINKRELIDFCNVRLSMIEDIKNYTAALAEGLREPQQ
jgi:Ni2+-binding GTPase involved in maturation of urease and hydrogenase